MRLLLLHKKWDSSGGGWCGRRVVWEEGGVVGGFREPGVDILHIQTAIYL
jgi:hypothetical protein